MVTIDAYFNPRPPRGGRRLLRVKSSKSSSYFNPRPPRGGRPCACWEACETLEISIHALREEGDPDRHPGCHDHCISIHALREEGDLNFCPECGRQLKFQSTPSARRATHDLFHSPGFVYEFQSTPSARRATLMALPSLSRMAYFNPRPPRGGRRSTTSTSGAFTIFQSTPSARRATGCDP